MDLHRKNTGFSLVEIVLALGIAAFALMAVLGLLSVAVNSGKEASDDTLLVNMADDLLATWRGAKFDEVPSKDAPASAQTSPVTVEIYFNENGARLQDSNGTDLARTQALAKGAIYRCAAIFQTDSKTQTGTANLLNVELIFNWPAMAANPQKQKIVHASLARY